MERKMEGGRERRWREIRERNFNLNSYLQCIHKKISIYMHILLAQYLLIYSFCLEILNQFLDTMVIPTYKDKYQNEMSPHPLQLHTKEKDKSCFLNRNTLSTTLLKAIFAFCSHKKIVQNCFSFPCVKN